MLLEDLIANKTGFGAEWLFQPDTLEVKENKNGVKGVFAKIAIPKGTQILSMPQKNGSLTELRAYEEAMPLLKRIGDERFDVSRAFVLACAIYLRFLNASKNANDIFVTDKDIHLDYPGTPMTATGSEAVTCLLFPNSELLLKDAVKQDLLIKHLDVDENKFYAALAYVQSRNFERAGIIPVFDWFNSSYGNAANMAFCIQNNCFVFEAIQDINSGTELTWNYNQHDAIITWYNYGYVDTERPTFASLELSIEKFPKDAFEEFVKIKLGYAASDYNQLGKVNDCELDYRLSNPSEIKDKRELNRQTLRALLEFNFARSWFRTFVLFGTNEVKAHISEANLASDRNVFGIDIEQETISRMHAALKTGAENDNRRVESFSLTELGSAVDIEPYTQMKKKAYDAWNEVFSLLESLLSATSEAEMISVANKAFDLRACSREEIITALKTMDSDSPTLITGVFLKYLDGFLR